MTDLLLRRAVGRTLRTLRHGQRRTLQEVADAAGVSLAHLSAIERGVSEVSSEVLAAICRALGISLADLLDHVRRQLVTRGRAVRLCPDRNPFRSTPRAA